MVETLGNKRSCQLALIPVGKIPAYGSTSALGHRCHPVLASCSYTNTHTTLSLGPAHKLAHPQPLLPVTGDFLASLPSLSRTQDTVLTSLHLDVAIEPSPRAGAEMIQPTVWGLLATPPTPTTSPGPVDNPCIQTLWHQKCTPQTTTLGGLVRNADSQAHPGPTESEPAIERDGPG